MVPNRPPGEWRSLLAASAAYKRLRKQTLAQGKFTLPEQVQLQGAPAASGGGESGPTPHFLFALPKRKRAVDGPRRHKLHIPYFRLTAKMRSFHCASSPHRTR